MINIKDIKFNTKTRIYIIIVAILLGVNSLNIMLDKAIAITVTIELFGEHLATSYLFEVYSEFCWIWIDILTLGNGLFFVFLF
jgi:hypothetical protein